MTDPEKCIALVTLFSLIDGAMNPHGFDIEETDYDIISSDPGHCFGFTGSRRAFTLARSS